MGRLAQLHYASANYGSNPGFSFYFPMKGGLRLGQRQQKELNTLEDLVGVKRTKTWPEYPLRIASRRMGVFLKCVLCHYRIAPGERYFNGGSRQLHAHVVCGMAAHRKEYPALELNPAEVTALAHTEEGSAA